MSSSSGEREYSPDWLRNHQAPAPTTSIWTLTSTSSSSSSSSEDDKDDQLPISSVITNRNSLQAQHPNPKVLQHDDVLEEPSNSDSSKKSLRLQDDMIPAQAKITKQENEALERDTTHEKQTGPYISSSSLPLVLADKVQRSKVLVECEGESIDLSGDLGSVGRVVISDSPSGNQDMLLDLKGTIYKTTITPSRTLCVVSFGQSEAKIEAIMNDFIQLKPQSNVYEAETMVEGTLEGFSFDSEDEGDKHASRQTDENEGGEPETNGKSRGRSEAAKKKGKTAVKKPSGSAKKVNKKKAPVVKKTKAKK